VTDDIVDDTTSDAAPSASAQVEDKPQYGVGPFSIREVALGGVWLVSFILSFFPISTLAGPQGVLFGGANVWVSGLSWILTIALPTIAVFLIALRRLSPQGIRRVGSLGIDQFASVAFSVSLVVWLTWIWETVSLAIQFGAWARSWVIWVEAVLMLAGVVLTVFAPLIPGLKDDFAGRPEIPAHRNARPVRAISPRPVRERPAPAPAAEASAYTAAPHAAAPHAHDATGPQAPYAQDATGPQAAYAPVAEPAPAADDSSTSVTDVFAPLHADQHAAEPAPVTEPEWAADETVVSAQQAAHAPATEEYPASASQPAAQAFWALVPEERDVVDAYGAPLFRIGPTAWALVIEDRGEVFIMRHEDGRIGYLHDVSGVTRG